MKPQITEEDLEELADKIRDGYTSGRLDNGEGKHITWDLKTIVWEDEQEEGGE